MNTRCAQVAAAVGLVAVLAGCSGESAPITSAGASCPAPEVSLSSARVSAGDPVDVTITDLYSDCHDQGEGRSPIAQDVEVVFTQGGRSTTIAVVDGDAEARVETVMTVPAGAEPGPATVTVLTAEPAELEVVAAA